MSKVFVKEVKKKKMKAITPPKKKNLKKKYICGMNTEGKLRSKDCGQGEVEWAASLLSLKASFIR